MNQKIKVIIKDETLGFDIGSLLSNPLVSTGMNAVLPGSGMVASFLAPSLSQKPAKKPSALSSFLSSQAVRKPTISAPPRPQTQTQKIIRSTPPPPRSTQRAGSFLPIQPAQAPTPTATKEGIDKNLLLFGGLVLAGGTVLFLSNQKGRRK